MQVRARYADVKCPCLSLAAQHFMLIPTMSSLTTTLIHLDESQLTNSPRFNPKICLWTLWGRQYPGRLDSSLQYSRHDPCTFPATKNMLRNLICTCPVESQQANGSAAKILRVTQPLVYLRQRSGGKWRDISFRSKHLGVWFFLTPLNGWWIWIEWDDLLGTKKPMVIWVFFVGCMLMERIEAPKFVEKNIMNSPRRSWRGLDRGSLGLDILGWSWFSYQQT